MSEYYHKFKGMADSLADLGSPIDDWILVLNILRALNQRFEHVSAIIQRYSSLPSFLKARDDLLLEEIHLDTSGLAAASTTLYSNSVPDNGNDNGGNNNCRNSGNNDKNNNNGSSRGGNSGSTTAAPSGPTNNDNKGTPPWPTFINPWQGHTAMYLGPCPLSSIVCMPSWPHSAITHPWVSYPGDSPAPSPG
jgi:hypothetical protein